MPEPIFSSVQTFTPVIANAVWQSSKIIHEGHYLILDCFVTSLLVSGDKPQVCMPEPIFSSVQTFTPVIANAEKQSGRQQY